MQVQVNVKRIGKRRNAIETRPYEIGEVRDVGGLIAAFVTAEVTRFNARAEVGETALRYLTSEEIADAATVGKSDSARTTTGRCRISRRRSRTHVSRSRTASTASSSTAMKWGTRSTRLSRSGKTMRSPLSA